ncbi:MAG TPA: methionyl-tRNA formyltransferase [Phycisphaerae bacterium]|nr:methionyl-tRNA formyltransferase [Phycisphaerae bacterium]
MRIVYCGSGAFSVPSFQAVLASGHEVVGVVTQPARPAGRGGKVRPTPLAEAARQAGREVHEYPDINAEEAVEQLRRLRPDVLCVVDFGQLISRAVMDSAPLGAMNLHASLLPKLRGAAPINWAILRGHKRTGVTTFRIVKAMDAGPIYLQRATDIGPDETAEQLKRRLAGMGAELVCETLGLLASGWAEATEQDHAQATLAPRLKKGDGVIDWTADAEGICNLARGSWPWPGAQTTLCLSDGRSMPVALAAAEVAEGASRGGPGTLDEELAASTGRGRVRVRQIRPAGKRLMEWQDFVNGYRPRAGDRFEAGTSE